MSLAICILVLHSIQQVKASGRVVLLGEISFEQRSIAGVVPVGRPPVLTFRYLEGAKRHGFGDLDLVIDDAGH